MAETAAQRKTREEAESASSADAGNIEAPSPQTSRNVLTDGIPQPPGVRERRARRIAKKRRQGPFVKYVGSASHRVIRPVDWNQLGFKPKGKQEAHSTFEWTPKNDYLIESDKFTDEQLDYLLIDDIQHDSRAHSFLEVDWDDQGQLVQVIDDFDDNSGE